MTARQSESKLFCLLVETTAIQMVKTWYVSRGKLLSGENKGKHWLVVVLPRTYSQTLSHTAAISRASHPAARSSTWWKTKENTGLVVVLPRTYAPNTLTLLPSPEPLILLPGPIPWRKQRKTLCWWWPYQELIPCQ